MTDLSMRSESPASPALFQAPLGADTRAAWILVALMVLLPTMGVPMQVLLLQDTFKSALLVFATLTAAVLFFWPQRDRPTHVVWHQIMWLPGALMLYALASMAWSHAYLAGVEAVRWFVLGLLLVLGANTLTPLRMTHLAWGIHIGAVLGATLLDGGFGYRNLPLIGAGALVIAVLIAIFSYWLEQSGNDILPEPAE